MPRVHEAGGDRGRRPARSGRVRLVDVAELAGVDVAVVSKVLNGDTRLSIRPETRQRVLDAVESSGYRPNALARGLRQSRTDMYGMVIPDFSNPIYAQIIEGAERRADSAGKLILATTISDRDGDSFSSALGQGRIDGLLVASTLRTSPGEIVGTHMPWLYLNRQGPGARRYVCLDDERAAQLAVDHLIELGHRRIGHVTGPTTADTARRRTAGYRRSLRDAGLRVMRTDTAQADYTAEGGAAAARALLDQTRRPTAIFVANVASAIGVIWEVHRHRLRIPEDVSVVAIHDLPLAEYLHPPLTTVRMPLTQLGERGVDILSSLPASAVVQEVVSEPMELVVRESTAPPP